MASSSVWRAAGAAAVAKHKTSRSSSPFQDSVHSPRERPREPSQAERAHVRLFVGGVLAGIAQADIEAAGLLGQGPDEAFAGGKDLRLALENRIVESASSIDPLPALVCESADYILQV